VDSDECPAARFEDDGGSVSGHSFVTQELKEGDEMDLWLVLFWTGPIGIGIFLAGLGVLFWGIAQTRGSEKKKE